MNLKGRVTLPAQAGFEKDVLRLAKLWGADAVRDSDGTILDKEILESGLRVYSTLCLIREDTDWAKLHWHCLQQIYLLSKPKIAISNTLNIDLMDGFYSEQFEVDTYHDPSVWWEVRDRTSDTKVDVSDWNFQNGVLSVNHAKKYHMYTATFLAYQIWEPVSMYNYKLNKWTSEHRMPVDPRQPEAHIHLLEVLKDWLLNHPATNVVRFTTFCYNFDLIYGERGKEKRVDWFGYSNCVSPLAIEQFEKEYGYKLEPEFFVNKGYYHSPFLVPTQKYLDWMDFNQRFVSKLARECVDLVHQFRKKAIMFLGDQWIGTEPYGKYFNTIGLDMVVGAAGDGVTTRMITDIPIRKTELRFYPYFFPDIFCEGGNPVGEMQKTWQRSRRAVMRSPADRIGFGGYLNLAIKFPNFENYVAKICDEFRTFHLMTHGTKPYSASFKVCILNAWGSIRSWMTHQVAHSLWNQRTYSYLGILEALAGLPFEVKFISFDDIKKNGVPKNTGVVLNIGDSGTAWSGGNNWLDEKVLVSLRKFVSQGGGFIGVGEPTAVLHNGFFFQLSDILGVEKECGLTLSIDKIPLKANRNHFIMRDATSQINYGEEIDSIFLTDDHTEVLDVRNGGCAAAVHQYGKGRSVYFTGLPYNSENQRILLRAIFWAASKEEEMHIWFSRNEETECYAYPTAMKFAVINNSQKAQNTEITTCNNRKLNLHLSPLECKWLDMQACENKQGWNI